MKNLLPQRKKVQSSKFKVQKYLLPLQHQNIIKSIKDL